MKLKYKSISWIDSPIDNSKLKEDIFETDYIPYKESTKNEYLVLDFNDGKKDHHLELSKDEIFIKYGEQIINLKYHKYASMEYKTPEKNLIFDWYLKNVNIGLREITFEYDILHEKNLLTSNLVSLKFQK